MKKIGCVLMAAGNAQRFHSNKLLAVFRGKPLIQWALEAIPPVDRLAVVTQYDEIAAAAAGCEVYRNEHPDRGISHTIAIGTKALSDMDALIFCVADQPLLSQATLRRLMDTWLEAPDCIISAACNGKRGNPCIFPREFFPELAQLQGDRGGSQVIKAHPDRLRTVEVSPAELVDVDTPELLQALTHA